MKEYWLKLQNWWLSLALRQQRALLVGGLAITIFLVYQFIWLGAFHHFPVMRAQIHQQEKLLAWMQTADKELRRLERQPNLGEQALSTASFEDYLHSLTEQASLTAQIVALKPVGSDAVEIEFVNVEFDKLMQLLLQIHKEQPVVISQLSVVAVDAPGAVNAAILFHFLAEKA